ncbi:hypothetical protein [Mucilaginibacter sp. BT774]|uniref:hypothetical protein n=1 Tax=Mucilaginibacter sp. BT774 TaxID=3062276 RepID=UPI00267693C8|nr:hypothetical protein [Mucilaginibacter sp. BT774]MDO3628687.1 hypothetical protein [Mucilaginibacter sp. BT774]
MFNRTLLLISLVLSSAEGFSQVKEIVERDVRHLRYLPYGQFGSQQWRKEERINARFRKENPAYHEVLALDTAAIPYLIDMISDSTEANIRVPCAAHNLKVGDVAFALLNDIIVIPWHTVTGEQWDSYSCDALPDGGWGYLYYNRVKFQSQLRLFFATVQGRMWVSMFKDKHLDSETKTRMVKRFKNLSLAPSEVVATTGE